MQQKTNPTEVGCAVPIVGNSRVVESGSSVSLHVSRADESWFCGEHKSAHAAAGSMQCLLRAAQLNIPIPQRGRAVPVGREPDNGLCNPAAVRRAVSGALGRVAARRVQNVQYSIAGTIRPIIEEISAPPNDATNGPVF
jgi:hypothetical protein